MSQIALEYRITGMADTSALRQTTEATKALSAAAKETAAGAAAASPALRGIALESKSAATAVAEMNAKLSEGFGSKLTSQFIARFTSPEFLTGLAVAGGIAANKLINSMADQMIATIQRRGAAQTTAQDRVSTLRDELATAPANLRPALRAEAAGRADQLESQAALPRIGTDERKRLSDLAALYRGIATTDEAALDALATRRAEAEQAGRAAEQFNTDLATTRSLEAREAANLEARRDELAKTRATQLTALEDARTALAKQNPATRETAILDEFERKDADLRRQRDEAAAELARRPEEATRIREGFETARAALAARTQLELNTLARPTGLDLTPPRLTDNLTRIGADFGTTAISGNRAAETTATNTAQMVSLLRQLLSRPVAQDPLSFAQ